MSNFNKIRDKNNNQLQNLDESNMDFGKFKSGINEGNSLED